MILSQLCLIIGFSERKRILSYIFMTASSFTTWSKMLTELSSSLPREAEIGVLFSSMFPFQRTVLRTLGCTDSFKLVFSFSLIFA